LRQAGTRLTYPGGMEGWVRWPVSYIPRWFTRPQTVIHPSANPALHSRETNSQPVDHKSDALTITPTKSSICCKVTIHDTVVRMGTEMWYFGKREWMDQEIFTDRIPLLSPYTNSIKAVNCKCIKWTQNCYLVVHQRVVQLQCIDSKAELQSRLSSTLTAHHIEVSE